MAWYGRSPVARSPVAGPGLHVFQFFPSPGSGITVPDPPCPGFSNIIFTVSSAGMSPGP